MSPIPSPTLGHTPRDNGQECPAGERNRETYRRTTADSPGRTLSSCFCALSKPPGLSTLLPPAAGAPQTSSGVPRSISYEGLLPAPLRKFADTAHTC